MDDADITSQVDRAFARFRFDRDLNEIVHGRRRRSPRRTWALVAGTAVAVLALWAINASPFAGSPQLVLAGWEAAPTQADAALAAAAVGPCSSSDPAVAAMPIVAQDQRGTAATILLAGGGELSICVVARDETGTVVAAASGLTRLEPSAKALSVDSGLSAPRTANFPGLTVIAGRVGQGVASVAITRSDGVDVTATVASGYFVAWWPSTDKASTVTAKDESGRSVSVVDAKF